MASCLDCGNWINPRRWACEKCEDKIVKTGEGYKEAKKDDKRVRANRQKRSNN